MGQVSPAPQIDEAMLQRIERVVLQPTVEALAEAGTPLRGALFVDFMLVQGQPYAIDYNVRFGDPATQTILSSYSGDIYAALLACTRSGELSAAVSALTRDERPRVSVVLVCEGYPDRFVRGDAIRIDATVFAEDPDLTLFEDGVRVTSSGPETTGGRAFTVVAAGATREEARARAYRGARAIDFRGKHCRPDIGA